MRSYSDLLSKYDVNAAAASVKVYAIKPGATGNESMFHLELLLVKRTECTRLSSPVFTMPVAHRLAAGVLQQTRGP